MTGGAISWVLGALTVIGLSALVTIAVLVAGLIIVPPLTRRFTDRWGATAEETAEPLPGDELLDAKREVSTKAITINATPDVVYSLLVQMGQHRAGWYGWDWFYHLTKSSDFVDGHYSKRIVPELQDLAAGDEIAINDMVRYAVIAAERPRSLVLYVGTMAPGTTPEGEWSANSMSWMVEPLPGDRSRLLLRLRGDGSETGFGRWIWNGPLDFGGAIFSRKTMAGLKRVAEDLAGR